MAHFLYSFEKNSHKFYKKIQNFVYILSKTEILADFIKNLLIFIYQNKISKKCFIFS